MEWFPVTPFKKFKRHKNQEIWSGLPEVYIDVAVSAVEMVYRTYIATNGCRKGSTDIRL